VDFWFWGRSETIDESASVFQAEDKAHGIIASAIRLHVSPDCRFLFRPETAIGIPDRLAPF